MPQGPWSVARVFSTLAIVDGMVVRAERGDKLVIEEWVRSTAPSCSEICQQIIADDKRVPPGLLRWLRLRARAEVRGDRNLSDVEDLEEAPEGLLVTIRRSKTDQEGIGRKVAIPRGEIACPVRDHRGRCLPSRFQ